MTDQQGDSLDRMRERFVVHAAKAIGREKAPAFPWGSLNNRTQQECVNLAATAVDAILPLLTRVGWLEAPPEDVLSGEYDRDDFEPRGDGSPIDLHGYGMFAPTPVFAFPLAPDNGRSTTS